MKFELDLIGPAPEDRPAIEDTRRRLREATDALIRFDRWNEPGVLDHVASSTAGIMVEVAKTLRDHVGQEPDVTHLVSAFSSIIADLRNDFDRALFLRQWDACLLWAVAIEVCARGICAALGIDYEAAMRKAAAPPDEQQIH